MATTAEKLPHSRVADNSHGGPYSGAGNDDDSGCATEEYSWSPPGLTPEQVNICLCLYLL